jgi:hypothetical protein
MSTFLSFIAALITTTLVESQRQDETPNAVIHYPNGPWILVNVVSGAVVAPLMMVPASFHHSKIYLQKSLSQQNSISANMKPNRPINPIAKLAIPLSVAGGFVLPSVLLLFASSPTVVIIWQFFPIYVAALSKLFELSLRTQKLTTYLSNISQYSSKVLLFTLPILLSVLSHAGLIICVIYSPFSSHPTNNPLTSPALLILAINFGAILLTLFYWLYVEGGLWAVKSALKWTLIAGPGAGVCFGWIAREDAMLMQLVQLRDENHVDGTSESSEVGRRNEEGARHDDLEPHINSEAVGEEQPLLTQE